MRPSVALYIGGMGAKSMNFHFDVFSRMGYEAEATKIQELYLDGRKDEAAAAVPDLAHRGHRPHRSRRRRSGTTSRGGGSPSPPPCWWPGDPDTLQTMAELVL